MFAPQSNYGSYGIQGMSTNSFQNPFANIQNQQVVPQQMSAGYTTKLPSYNSNNIDDVWDAFFGGEKKAGQIIGTAGGALLGAFAGSPQMGARMGNQLGGMFGGLAEQTAEHGANIRMGGFQPEKYADGGKVPIEAEGNEIVTGDGRQLSYLEQQGVPLRKISQKQAMLQGPSHEQGGIKFMAPDGLRIIPEYDAQEYMRMNEAQRRQYDESLPVGGSYAKDGGEYGPQDPPSRWDELKRRLGKVWDIFSPFGKTPEEYSAFKKDEYDRYYPTTGPVTYNVKKPILRAEPPATEKPQPFIYDPEKYATEFSGTTGRFHGGNPVIPSVQRTGLPPQNGQPTKLTGNQPPTKQKATGVAGGETIPDKKIPSIDKIDASEYNAPKTYTGPQENFYDVMSPAGAPPYAGLKQEPFDPFANQPMVVNPVNVNTTNEQFPSNERIVQIQGNLRNELTLPSTQRIGSGVENPVGANNATTAGTNIPGAQMNWANYAGYALSGANSLFALSQNIKNKPPQFQGYQGDPRYKTLLSRQMQRYNQGLAPDIKQGLQQGVTRRFMSERNQGRYIPVNVAIGLDQQRAAGMNEAMNQIAMMDEQARQQNRMEALEGGRGIDEIRHREITDRNLQKFSNQKFKMDRQQAITTNLGNFANTLGGFGQTQMGLDAQNRTLAAQQKFYDQYAKNQALYNTPEWARRLQAARWTPTT